MAPSIYTGDSGEIAIAIYTWGIAHPTGFPVYTISAKLFSYLLPWLEFAHALNIFSALTSAITIILLFFIFKKIKIGYLAAASASLSLAFGFSFWSHAQTIQVYSITTLFFVLAILIFLQWLETKKPQYLYLLAVIYGLGAGTHLTFLLFFPFAFTYFLYKLLHGEIKPRAIHCLLFLIIFAATTALIYSYIPLRAAQLPEFNWGDPSNKERFIHYITQRDWSYKMASRNFESWKMMLNETGRLFIREFTFTGLILILLGSTYAFKKYKGLFYGGLAVIIFNILLMGNYGSTRSIIVLWRYFLPSYIIMAIFLGLALEKIFVFLQNHKMRNFAIIMMAVPSLIFAFHIKDLSRRHKFVPKMMQDVFESIPKKSIFFLSSDTFLNAAQYKQMVLGERRDVLILHPDFWGRAWYLEQKKKEIEKNEFQYADSIAGFIENNKNEKIYSLFELDFLKDYVADTYPEGLVFRYEIKGASKKSNLMEIKNINDTFWKNRDLNFLKNEKINRDPLLKNILIIYMAALNNYGAYLVNSGYVEEGIIYFKKVLDIRDDMNESRNALFNLIAAYSNLGDSGQAMEYKNKLNSFGK